MNQRTRAWLVVSTCGSRVRSVCSIGMLISVGRFGFFKRPDLGPAASPRPATQTASSTQESGLHTPTYQPQRQRDCGHQDEQGHDQGEVLREGRSHCVGELHRARARRAFTTASSSTATSLTSSFRVATRTRSRCSGASDVGGLALANATHLLHGSVRWHGCRATSIKDEYRQQPPTSTWMVRLLWRGPSCRTRVVRSSTSRSQRCRLSMVNTRCSDRRSSGID